MNGNVNKGGNRLIGGGPVIHKSSGIGANSVIGVGRIIRKTVGQNRFSEVSIGLWCYDQVPFREDHIKRNYAFGSQRSYAPLMGTEYCNQMKVERLPWTPLT